ncbi:chemotaxis protein CheA [Jannaschia donghaensis]|uniref:Chemotaxis protein CheA n=1 Tax=Jannaschia donghaensis TaxID=420998 RepID=A0A0M6YN48_9RHOB|nr:chemotaxis protein CheA [Jannaschia donghaensis]CTQ50667.1 Chemotaxis protein CheA [Jannaschia donghaensis]
MNPFDAIMATFFEECGDLMESLESGLLALQSGDQDVDTIDAVFRAVHSIKGGAGAFDLAVLVAFAHEFETSLDALRSGRLMPDPAVIAVLLRASDQLGDLVSASRSAEESVLPDTSDLRALVSDLADGSGTVDEEISFAPLALDLEFPASDQSDDLRSETAAASETPRYATESCDCCRKWILQFEPLPDLLISGNEPLFLFRALEVMGPLKVEAFDADLPPLSEMDPKEPRLRWKIVIAPSAPDLTETEIESVFEFAVNLCVLDIVCVEESAPSGDVSAITDPADPVAGSSLPAPLPDDTPRVAQLGNEPSAPSGRLPSTAPRQFSTTIRVDLARVDRLVNLVGELVISQSMLAQGMTRAGLDQHSEAVSNLDDLQQLTRDMQDSVMAIRAQPVKSLFQRMTRIVRETAQATEKQVTLETEGEATEIDKTVVERLADPLTHMIRNAIDHGLETPKERMDAGKAPAGILRLSARQQSDRVVIEISDDGRGIDRTRVLKRALECGLIPEGKTLEAAEIDRLLFMPGFSTSTEVSALSGRGVGMDVVQRAIRDLNGTISIASSEGQGCKISISLPLTLAILDGMIVRSNDQRMVIPLSVIVETQTLSTARTEHIAGRHPVARLHDRYVPMIDLSVGMGFPTLENLTAGEDAALLFVEPDEGGPFAIRVDAIEAQRQVVIKGLGENFGNVPCVSAATILGDGQIALIVDPIGIAASSGFHECRPTVQPEARVI